jgi:hypothetical protein
VIEISRSLARRLSAVIRNSIRKPYYPHAPVVALQTNAQGLCVRTAQGEVAVEYQQPGAFRPATVTLPLDALARVEGRDDGPVILEPGSDGQTVARWEDGGVPQVMAFPIPEAHKPPAFPTAPDEFVSNPPELLTALAEAGRSAADAETRYALHRLLLRGAKGEVVGTDSKELYIHGGFTFGWPGDVMVTRVAAFGRPEVGPAEAVEVGKTDQNVAIRVGPWTIFLGIDVQGRYPPVDMVVPRPSAATTTCRFAPGDAEFLLRSLPRLPGKADFNRPLTIDLNGKVSIRARAADQAQTTELVLARTDYSGPATRLNLNRDQLSRALHLGFTELRVVKADKPMFCRDDRRTFLMMPLAPQDALPPADDPLRITSDGVEPSGRIHRPQRVRLPMSTASMNGDNRPTATTGGPTTAGPAEANRSGLAGLISEAQAVREAARDTFARAGRLLGGIKRHRQQSRLVATTLASLKQLQPIDG